MRKPDFKYGILIICLVFFPFSGNTQINTKIDITLKGQTLNEFFRAIESKTDYSFMYNDIDLDQRVDIDAIQTSLEDVLNTTLPALSLTYEIRGKQILIKPGIRNPLQSTPDTVLIYGYVTDLSGDPVIGANVYEKYTTNGSITDMEGRFTLKVKKNAILVVSYIGFLSQEIPVGSKTKIEVILKEDSQALDEVIVIGYGTAKRKDFTGSVVSVKMENSPIAQMPNMNALESLKGNVAGLDIGYTNSAGATPGMQIRGQNSISGSNDPLVVLDGVIFMGSINDINPNDIASFDILKDATSAAAYGSRSANGVVIITTKKGKRGKPVINFNVTGSMSAWHRRPEIMNGEQWLDATSAKYTYSDYGFLSAQQTENYEAGKEINWFDVVTRTGWIQDYQVSVSGAGENMNYYLSGSYTDNKGVVIGDDHKRASFMGKIDTDITSWLHIGADVRYTQSDYPSVGASLWWPVILSPYDMMYRDSSEKLLEKYPNGTNGSINPLWGIKDGTQDKKQVYDVFHASANARVKLPWIPGLSYTFNYAGMLNLGHMGNFYHESFYVPVGPYTDEERYSAATRNNYLTSANGDLTEVKTSTWVIDNILNYTHTFDKHSIELTAVATRDYYKYEEKKMTGTNFAANGNTALGMNGLHFATTQKIALNNRKKTNVGYVGRFSYSYADTYYLTGSYRRDGASVFGVNNKWGNFSALGGAWRISNEPFLQQARFLNDLKVKLSWGKNGNQGISQYTTLSTIANGSTGNIYQAFGNNGEPYYGINQSSIGNAYLGWETTEAWNTGFESVWMDNRVFFDVDVYFSRTYDQIFNRSIPVMTGFNTMYSSMGEVSNRGVEMTLRTINIQSSDWQWSTGWTFWLNRNKLVHLYGEDLDGDGKEDDDIGNNLFIGQSIHSIYGYKQDGIVQTDDYDYMEKNKVAPGSPKYVDMNGDGVITVEDRTIIGNTAPNFKLNMSHTVSYKNWELYVMVTGVFGGRGYFRQSNQAAFLTSGGSNQFGANNIYIPYWTEENRSNKYPSPTFTGDSYFAGLQSRAYIRLQDITLSYSFREPWVKKAGINNLKVFFSAKNLLTFTGWEGGDPEIGSNIHSGNYPVLTSFSLGMNLSF